MMTRADLEAKRNELKAAYDKATAEMNAFGGALQFCEHLLSEFEWPENEEGEGENEG